MTQDADVPAAPNSSWSLSRVVIFKLSSSLLLLSLSRTSDRGFPMRSTFCRVVKDSLWWMAFVVGDGEKAVATHEVDKNTTISRIGVGETGKIFIVVE